MSARTRIGRGESLPDPTEPQQLYTNDGEYLGRLVFTSKNGSVTSVLEYADGQQPHQPYPLRAKHRQR